MIRKIPIGYSIINPFKIIKSMIKMKKRYILPLIGALATLGVKYWQKNKEDNSNTNTLANSLVNAGIPDQVDNTDLAQLENSKMVSEGSQFGVQYFNEIAAEESEETFRNITE